MTASQCPHCHAPVADLAATHCTYCRNALLPGAGGGVTLQGLRAASEADARAFDAALPVLAEQLVTALPGQVDVVRSKGGVLGRGRGAIRGLVVTLGDRRYEISVDGAARHAVVAHVVGGVALSHEEMPVAAWVAALQNGIERHAASQAGTAPALGRLLGPG